MSYVESDSEVEEVNTRLATTRPTPVRPKRVGGAVPSFEDDSDDDADFFVVRRPPEPVVESEESSEQNKVSTSSFYGQETSTNYDMGISSGSDDEDDEVRSGSGTAKRKHSDEENSRRQRSRSVSLTPPPMAPSSPKPLASPSKQQRVRKPRKAAVMQIDDNSSQCSDVLVLDSDNETATPTHRRQRVQRKIASDIADLDPALQAVVHFDDIGSPPRKTRLDTTGGSGTDHLLDKVQIEFILRFDDTFIMYEVPAVWNSARWRKIKPTDHAKIRKELSKCIAVVAFVSDTVENAVTAFSNELPVNVMAMEPILMVNQMRVFTTVSIGSLGTKPVHYVDVYPRTVYNRLREKEAVERAAQAMEQQQAMRDLELARVLRETVVATSELNDGVDNDETGGPTEDSAAAAETAVDAVRIKIRDKSGKDVLFQAAKTATIQAIIDNYKRIAKIDTQVNVRLEFDDETLDPRSRVGDTEIEDDDMITAFWN
ncbi:hypothetical protein EV175_006123 [Coemansia sp. RSA 1933]|nr:hypothetical protein EV175_006123 [Coemansia sp. RSA 1933]